MKANIIKVLIVAAIAFSTAAYGRGFHHGPPPGHYGPRVHYGPRHYHHHYSAWGHNGRYFWPGFAGAAVGTLVANTILPPPPPPVVVTPAPVVVNPAPVVVNPTPVVVPAPRPVIVW